MEEIVALAKRRGFVYPSSDIYGGLANSWDFGHYGTLLKNNIRDLWWKTFVLDREDMVALEASIMLNAKVWEASGHVSGFTDSLIDCKQCHFRTRADHLIEDTVEGIKVEGLSVEELTHLVKEHKIPCPKCGKKDFTDVRKFNLLFETKMGIIEGDRSILYLRGEIAQGIFLNFKNVTDTMRVSLPFGIAQQGKVFRNEITMGQFVHRTMEFDLMEFEYFIRPETWETTFEYWKERMWKFSLGLGLKENSLRWREHEEFERSHYSKKTMDIEYQYPFGWKEMFGIAYRTNFDLTNHMKNSGKDLSFTDPLTKEKMTPHVIEPTFGLSRLTGIVLTDSFIKEIVNGKERFVLKLNPKIAPVKAAIFPLQKDEKLYTISRELFESLKKQFVVEYDNRGNIGKMYRRQDEIGTPYCITVDYQTIKDQTVTIRDRDTMKQERILLSSVNDVISKRIINS